jgi:acetate kinase
MGASQYFVIGVGTFDARDASIRSMSATLLVLNAGSSSLKWSVFIDEDQPRLLLRGQVEGIPDRPRFVARTPERVMEERDCDAPLDHRGAIAFLFAWGRSGVLGSSRIWAVGHRVVHGGTKFAAPVRLDPGITAELTALTPFAPLHQVHNLAAISAVASLAPALPQVACFDTAFHQTQPDVAQAFALPRRYAREGVRRYGFHGLSYEYIASTFPAIDRRMADGRTVVAHLGNGASLCAMERGKSVASTMSFTALDGLVMGTRCGAIDPGVLLYLIDRYGMGARDLERLLYEESGLLGISGISSDMRQLLVSSDPRAAEAIDLFVYRVSRELGSMVAALGGLDALVFTGGIGEHAPAIRARVVRNARWLGLELDETANESGRLCISATGSRVSAWVLPTNEELMIARHTRRVLREEGEPCESRSVPITPASS